TYGTPAIEAAKHATSTVPIVFAEVGDALSIEGGTTLARPVRNLTGSSFLFPELAAKRLELLKQALPATTRVAVLVDPSNRTHLAAFNAMDHMATTLGVQLKSVDAARELPDAVSTAKNWKAQALAVLEGSLLLPSDLQDRQAAERRQRATTVQAQREME